MELYYHNWNKSENPNREKLVFLHGLGGTGGLWRPIAAQLENEINLLALDQRGHGKSRGPENSAHFISDYSPSSYGQDVIDTLHSLNFHPAWLVGHSMGVRTAVAAAHLKPEWIQGLILIDLGFSGIAGGGLGENLSRFLKLLPPQFDNRGEARKFMDTHCPDASMAQYLMAVSVLDAQGQVTFPFDHSALIQTIQSARGTSIREWVQELSVQGIPALILRGERSSVWSHEEFENERQGFTSFPNVIFKEVPNAGHGLPFEQRAVFVSLVREFLGTA